MADLHTAKNLTEYREGTVEVLRLVDELLRYTYRATEPIGCSGSQDNEDLLLIPLMEPCPSGSTYVDVGVYGPEDCSNTWKLYQQGWRGLLIEPVPMCWERILKKRPGDFLWPTAAGETNSAGTLNLYGPCSSFDPAWGPPGETRIIEIETLASILSHFPDVRDSCRLCSIDVEGWELQVLTGIDWETFHPDVFVIEYRAFAEPGLRGDDLSGNWIHLLTEHGYREIWRGEFNAIFLCNEREYTPSPDQ